MTDQESNSYHPPEPLHPRHPPILPENPPKKNQIKMAKGLNYGKNCNRRWLVQSYKRLQQISLRKYKFCQFIENQIKQQQQVQLNQQYQNQLHPLQIQQSTPHDPLVPPSSHPPSHQSQSQPHPLGQEPSSSSVNWSKSKNKGEYSSSQNKGDSSMNEKNTLKSKYKWNIIDEILHRADIIEPYMVGDFSSQTNANQLYYQRVTQSIMFQSCRLGKRQCAEPKVKIDGEIVFEFQNPSSNRVKKDYTKVTCTKNGSFMLSIEVQRNCSILMTKNGVNPLLEKNMENKIVAKKSYEERLTTPCTISVVAINQMYSLPSRVLTVVVRKNKTDLQRQEEKRNGGMVRPHPGLEMEGSRSNYSMVLWV